MLCCIQIALHLLCIGYVRSTEKSLPIDWRLTWHTGFERICECAFLAERT